MIYCYWIFFLIKTHKRLRLYSNSYCYCSMTNHIYIKQIRQKQRKIYRIKHRFTKHDFPTIYDISHYLTIHHIPISIQIYKLVKLQLKVKIVKAPFLQNKMVLLKNKKLQILAKKYFSKNLRKALSLFQTKQNKPQQI